MRAAERAHLALGQPAGRFVEQQQLWLCHQRASPARPASARRRAGRAEAGPRTPQPRARRGSPSPAPRFGAPPGSNATTREGGDRIAVQYRLGAEHHVLAHGQPGAQPDALQGAGNAELGQVMRVVPSQIATAVGEAAGARVDEPADDVEQRRLARAVRADHPDHLARHDRHRDVVEREDAAEADGDAVHGQDRFPSPASASAQFCCGLEDRAHEWDLRGHGGRRRPHRARPRSVHAYQPPGIVSDVTTFATRALHNRANATNPLGLPTSSRRQV